MTDTRPDSEAAPAVAGLGGSASTGLSPELINDFSMEWQVYNNKVFAGCGPSQEEVKAAAKFIKEKAKLDSPLKALGIRPDESSTAPG